MVSCGSDGIVLDWQVLAADAIGVPLYVNARDVIRTNLGRIRNKNKVHIVPIGTLTPVQLTTINASRLKQGLRPIEEEVFLLVAISIKAEQSEMATQLKT